MICNNGLLKNELVTQMEVILYTIVYINHTCDNPIVVVLLPSPRGVGVTPATTIYFPLVLSFNLSNTVRLTLALLCP